MKSKTKKPNCDNTYVPVKKSEWLKIMNEAAE